MVFPKYTDGAALTGEGRSAFESNRTLALEGDGVISGLATTQRGAGANMSVDVATGIWLVSSTFKGTGETTNVAITAAHATLDRYDLIYANSTGTIGVQDGTAAAAPKVPDIPTNSIALAVVSVPATDTSIEDSQITDLRFLLPTWTYNGYAAKTASDISNKAVFHYTGMSLASFSYSTAFTCPDGPNLFWNTPTVGGTVFAGGVIRPPHSPLYVLTAGDTNTLDTTLTGAALTQYLGSRVNQAYEIAPTEYTPPAWGSNSGTIADVTDGDTTGYDATGSSWTGSFYRASGDLPGSQSEDNFIKLDLGASYALQRISWAGCILCGSTDGTVVGTMKLYYSTNDSDYTLLTTKSNSKGSGGGALGFYENIASSNVTARYIKVTVTHDGGGGSGSNSTQQGLWEIVAWK